jgi:homogentisate phytyltransferase/homogentisate geranylgeranyltransferase
MVMELKTKAIIDKIEESKIGFLAFLLLLSSVILARVFLEDKVTLPFQHRFFSLVFLNHSATFYLSAFLSSTLLVCLLSKERVDKVSKSVLFGFGLIVIPPIIDYFTSKVVFYDYIYDPSVSISTPNWAYLIRAYLTFSTGMKGVTVGQQIEMILLLIFSALYVYTKTRSAVRTILTPISVYTLTFFYGTFPNYFSFGNLYETFNSSHNLLYYSSLFTVSIFIQGGLWLYLYDHSTLKAIIRKLDPGRTLHYLAMGAAGAWIAGIGHYTALLVLLCTFSGWLMSLAVNDIYDGDSAGVLKDSNQNTTDRLTLSEMRDVALFCGLLSVLIATILSYAAIVIVLLCTAVSMLYSLPPLRLKKYPILSTFLISSAAVLVFALGFYAEPPQRDFPTSLMYAMLICITLSFTTKDLKDYDKDRANNIWTIPVLFGPKKGRIIIAALDLLAYLLVPVILQIYKLLLPAVIFGVLTFLVVLRKQSKEWQIFLLYFLFLASAFVTM